MPEILTQPSGGSNGSKVRDIKKNYMKVICTKCGRKNVACEAMINPNDKSFRNYTDEAFLYGWCEDCGNEVVLSDVDEVKTNIDKLYADYGARHDTEPIYAQCEIVWKKGYDSYASPKPATIKLSTDIDDSNDEKILFYCNDIEELKSLAEFGGEDFVLTDCFSLTRELE